MKKNNKKMVSKEKVCGTGRLFTYKEFKEKLEGYKKDGHYEMALEGAKIGLPKLYKRYMDECQGNTISLAVSEDVEKLFVAVREQIGRVPFLSKSKCHKIFILNTILNSGLKYGEVMSFLDSLNAYEEGDKGWKKVSSNTPIEEKFDALGWEKVVKKLIRMATSYSNSLAA